MTRPFDISIAAILLVLLLPMLLIVQVFLTAGPEHIRRYVRRHKLDKLFQLCQVMHGQLALRDWWTL